MKRSLPSFRKQKLKVFENFANTGQFVYSIGDSPILRKKLKAVPFKKIAFPEFQGNLRYLKSCLRRYKKLTGLGKGIAAPQVGISEKFFIVWIDEKIVTIINPKITKESKQLLSYPEVCMSAYPLIAEVIRPSWIEFEYLDEKRNKKIWNTKDATKQGRILNRVFEHEIDHLEGIINIDKVPSRSLEFNLDPKSKPKFKKIVLSR